MIGGQRTILILIGKCKLTNLIGKCKLTKWKNDICVSTSERLYFCNDSKYQDKVFIGNEKKTKSILNLRFTTNLTNKSY